MVKVPEWKLQAFHWLKLDRWTPDYLLSGYQVGGKRYCKVCDQWVSPEDEKRHVAAHVKQRKEQIKKQREEANRIAREERKRKKLLEGR